MARCYAPARARGLRAVRPDRRSAEAETDGQQRVVERARLALDSFLDDPQFEYMRVYVQNAYAVLIVPEVLKAGFFLGGEYVGRRPAGARCAKRRVGPAGFLFIVRRQSRHPVRRQHVGPGVHHHERGCGRQASRAQGAVRRRHGNRARPDRRRGRRRHHDPVRRGRLRVLQEQGPLRRGGAGWHRGRAQARLEQVVWAPVDPIVREPSSGRDTQVAALHDSLAGSEPTGASRALRREPNAPFAPAHALHQAPAES